MNQEETAGTAASSFVRPRTTEDAEAWARDDSTHQTGDFLTVERHQLPVGDGAFHFCRIRAAEGFEPRPTTIVVDCGTRRRSDVSRSSVDRIRRTLITGCGGILDYLVLTDFTAEHVSLVPDLVSGIEVRNLITPLLESPEDRIHAAAEMQDMLAQARRPDWPRDLALRLIVKGEALEDQSPFEDFLLHPSVLEGSATIRHHVLRAGRQGAASLATFAPSLPFMSGRRRGAGTSRTRTTTSRAITDDHPIVIGTPADGGRGLLPIASLLLVSQPSGTVSGREGTLARRLRTRLSRCRFSFAAVTDASMDRAADEAERQILSDTEWKRRFLADMDSLMTSRDDRDHAALAVCLVHRTSPVPGPDETQHRVRADSTILHDDAGEFPLRQRRLRTSYEKAMASAEQTTLPEEAALCSYWLDLTSVRLDDDNGDDLLRRLRRLLASSHEPDMDLLPTRSPSQVSTCVLAETERGAAAMCPEIPRLLHGALAVITGDCSVLHPRRRHPDVLDTLPLGPMMPVLVTDKAGTDLRESIRYRHEIPAPSDRGQTRPYTTSRVQRLADMRADAESPRTRHVGS